MFSHIALGTNDLEASRRFYDACLGALGIAPGMTDDLGRLMYAHAGGRLMIRTPLDEAPATGANGGTIGFAADSADAVTAWFEAGRTHGGTAIEAPPGLRIRPGRRLFAAYLRDPAGNKLCAVHALPPGASGRPGPAQRGSISRTA